jgi:HTH-type transcriptional regulator/antitoxin HipB
MEGTMLIYTPTDIARIFKLHRKQRGISQAKIAEHTTIRQEMVSKFENRPENIRLQALLELMSALNLEVYIAPKPKRNSRRRWNGDW